MKGLKIAAFSCMFAVLVAAPDRASADRPPFFEHLYLLKAVDLYNSPKPGQRPIAALSAGQAVTVIDSDVQENSPDQSPKSYLVNTWIGEKWIKADYNAMYTGRYGKADREATLALETPLYDHPGAQETALRVAPQKVRITVSPRINGLPDDE